MFSKIVLLYCLSQSLCINNTVIISSKLLRGYILGLSKAIVCDFGGLCVTLLLRRACPHALAVDSGLGFSRV